MNAWDGIIAAVFGVVLGIIFGFAVLGVAFLANDARMFKELVEDCDQIGYIQNSHTRIYCDIEQERNE